MKDVSNYLHRDLSLLDFNERILREANDESVPLLERLVFLGIFSNNIGEFYRTRIARHTELLCKAKKKKKNRKKIDQLRDLLSQLNDKMSQLYVDFDSYYETIWTSLKNKKIILLDENKLSEEQSMFVKSFFREKVRQNITPILLDKLNRIDFLREQSSYLIVQLRSTQGECKQAEMLIEVPTGQLSRFVALPQTAGGETPLIYLDDVIRFCLPDIIEIFGFDSFEAFSIQFARDEDVELNKDRKDYIEDIRRGIKSRRFGNVVRLVYDKNMPGDLQKKIARKFGIRKKRILTEGGRYHHLNDLVGICDVLNFPELRYSKLDVVPSRFLPENQAILDSVRQRDVLLSYPYQSFQNIVEMLLQASVDPKVESIKMTIYRAAKNSRVINALINAARNGKDITVYVELQASFDEEANIDWAKILDAEGIRTVYYAPGGLKVHSKLLIIRRRENDGQMLDYTAIGTGNPNEKTSRIYCDHHLLTSDPRLTSDVDKVFKLLESDKLKKPKFEALVVSPFATRQTFMGLFDQEIANAKRGIDAWAVIKLNNLADKRIVDKMYEASQAGVKIRCVIRGICILLPGVEGLSENITAIRIVDRFLEHARVMVFANGGDPLFFMGSADWMGRNFDERVEVTTPIYETELQQELMQLLEIQLHDNVKAESINASDSIIPGKKKIRSQIAQYELLKEKNTLIMFSCPK